MCFFLSEIFVESYKSKCEHYLNTYYLFSGNFVREFHLKMGYAFAKKLYKLKILTDNLNLLQFKKKLN